MTEFVKDRPIVCWCMELDTLRADLGAAVFSWMHAEGSCKSVLEMTQGGDWSETPPCLRQVSLASRRRACSTGSCQPSSLPFTFGRGTTRR